MKVPLTFPDWAHSTHDTDTRPRFESQTPGPVRGVSPRDRLSFPQDFSLGRVFLFLLGYESFKKWLVITQNSGVMTPFPRGQKETPGTLLRFGLKGHQKDNRAMVGVQT